jgi:competence protein ComFC
MNDLVSTSKTALDAVLNLIYPPVCQICRKSRATADSGYVCMGCFEGANGVRFIRPPFCERCGLPFEGEFSAPFRCANCHGIRLYFQAARSAVVAKTLVLDVIHRYKYLGQLWFEPFLSGLLEQAARPWLAREEWDMVIPVPLHPAKRRERGFNQAGRLGAAFAAFAGLPLNAKSLCRVKTTQTQTRLSQTERAANVREAFHCDSGGLLKGRRIILVDDVMTTGATTNACARVLLGAGAGAVCVWTVARGV